METLLLTPPKSIRMRRKGRSRTNLETPTEAAHCANDKIRVVLFFAKATWRLTYRVRAITSTNDVHPRVQEVFDLPVLNLSVAHDEDPDLIFIKLLLRDHDVRPSWDTVREESAEVKILWTQFNHLKIQEKVLHHRRKEIAANPQWQVVAPKPLRSQIFKACHHHAMAAHQVVVRTAALIKRRFYWPRVQKDVNTCGAKDAQLADAARPLYETTVNYNSPDMVR